MISNYELLIVNCLSDTLHHPLPICDIYLYGHLHDTRDMVWMDTLDSLLDFISILCLRLIERDYLIAFIKRSLPTIHTLDRKIVYTSDKLETKEMISNLLCVIHIFVCDIDSDDVHDEDETR